MESGNYELRITNYEFFLILALVHRKNKKRIKFLRLIKLINSVAELFLEQRNLTTLLTLKTLSSLLALPTVSSSLLKFFSGQAFY